MGICNKCGNILSIKQGSTKSIHKIVLESSTSTNKKIENVIHAVNPLPQAKRPRFLENVNEIVEVSNTENVDMN